MEYLYVTRDNYFSNRQYYMSLIDDMFRGDDNPLAVLDDIMSHLDFIFDGCSNAFLILLVQGDVLLSMVNLAEYNSLLHEWSVFSLFTNKDYRNCGYGSFVFKYALEKLRLYSCSKLISGIKGDNVGSILLHEKFGFYYSGLNWDDLAQGFPSGHLGFVLKK